MPTIPKRDDQRRNRATPKADHEVNNLPEPIGPEIPRGLGITGIGRQWYESLRTSGQSVYYTDSDWASALFVARAMTDYSKASGPGKGSLMTGILRGMSALMATEGDRRKVRLELDRNDKLTDAEAASAGAASMQEYRDRLSG